MWRVAACFSLLLLLSACAPSVSPASGLFAESSPRTAPEVWGIFWYEGAALYDDGRRAWLRLDITIDIAGVISGSLSSDDRSCLNGTISGESRGADVRFELRAQQSMRQCAPLRFEREQLELSRRERSQDPPRYVFQGRMLENGQLFVGDFTGFEAGSFELRR